MKHKLIAVALIAVLLCTVLGNGIGCTTTTTYTLTMTISSTAGGSVTPAVGAHTCNASQVVNLTATPDSGYRFVNWTGGGADIDDDEDATTTITMNADHTVTANFALGVLIENVPDTNQPPTQCLATTIDPTNYCAPIAMVNILGYWDAVMGHSNAENLTAFQQPANLSIVAEYLGYFMDTNNQGSPDRLNVVDGHLGTWNKDIGPGTVEFVRWDATHAFPVLPPPPAFGLPAGKLGYDWTVTQNCTTVYDLSLDFYTDEIDAGRPLVVSFDYWNPDDEDIAVVDPETGETIAVFSWGEQVPCSYYPDPEECWDDDIGHAVTGVGYILDWDPDGLGGPLGEEDYVIVHDNWAPTNNIAIPWENWKCLYAVDPGADV